MTREFRLRVYKQALNHVLDSPLFGHRNLCQTIVREGNGRYNSNEYDEFYLFWPDFIIMNRDEKINLLLLCIEMTEP